MTSLDGINRRSIQMLLRGENDSKQSDEIQANSKLGIFQENNWKKNNVNSVHGNERTYAQQS